MGYCKNPKVKIEFQGVEPDIRISMYGVITLEVSFRAYYGEMPFYGGSDDIAVIIGDEGKILGFYGMWREVKEVGKVEITVGVEEAIKRLASEHGLRSNPSK